MLTPQISEIQHALGYINKTQVFIHSQFSQFGIGSFFAELLELYE